MTTPARLRLSRAKGFDLREEVADREFFGPFRHAERVAIAGLDCRIWHQRWFKSEIDSNIKYRRLYFVASRGNSIVATGQFAEWQAEWPESNLHLFEAMDAETQADADLGGIMMDHWDDYEQPFPYGHVVEFRRLVTIGCPEWFQIASYIIETYYSRYSVLLLKAFPLEFEGEGPPKRSRRFKSRRAAMMRLYQFRLGVRPLPGPAGRREGWMWRPLRADCPIDLLRPHTRRRVLQL